MLIHKYRCFSKTVIKSKMDIFYKLFINIYFERDSKLNFFKVLRRHVSGFSHLRPNRLNGFETSRYY